MDLWNPVQYDKFKLERARPFWDLVGLLKKTQNPRIIDLGCGTGELTQKLHEKFAGASTLGLDSSAKMLNSADAVCSRNLSFVKGDVETFNPENPYDIVFSNAALQWVENHEEIFRTIFKWVSPGGQIAFQMPYNFEHPSHQIASSVAQDLFASVFDGKKLSSNVLPLEKYSELLQHNGFIEQECVARIYGHQMPSGRSVIEWTKGTLLTKYQARLTPKEFEQFLYEYEKRLLVEIGEGPYFYAFKRMLIWGRKND